MNNKFLRYKQPLQFILRSLALMAVMIMVSLNVVAQISIIDDVDGLNGMTANGNYKITADIDASAYTPMLNDAFQGTLTAEAKADGTFPVISGLTKPLFTTATADPRKLFKVAVSFNTEKRNIDHWEIKQ